MHSYIDIEIKVWIVKGDEDAGENNGVCGVR